MLLTFEEETHTYFLDGRQVPGITSIISALGIGHNHTYTDPIHSQRGRAVHRAVELYNKGTLDPETVAPIAKPYFDAYLKFREDTDFRPLHSELRLGHEGLWFAGTLDLSGYLNNQLGIVEIKTTDSLDAEALKAQLCAQSVLWRKNFPRRPLRWKYGLQLRSDGTPNLITKFSKESDSYWVLKMVEFKKKAAA